MEFPSGLNKLTLTSLVLMLAVGTLPVYATEWSEIYTAGTEVKQLATGFKFTEGPAWHPDGFLIFTDIPNERVVRYDESGKTSDFFTPSGRCNGLMCDQAGFVYACQMGQGQVLKLEKTGQLRGLLVEQFEGKRLNGPNDLALDGQGGMYFTDPYYGPDKELPQPMMAVYYVTATGKVKRIIEDRERPNGVTVSPDGKFLYVAEPNKSEVYRYDILAPGEVSVGKLIFTGEGNLDGSGPDGMTHDVHGNLYCTYNGIVVLNPEGDLLGRIPTPEKPANCTFGGADNKTLFITARTSLYSVALNQPGIELMKTGPVLPVVHTSMKMQQNLIVQTVAEESAKTVTAKAGSLNLEVPQSWESQPPSNNLRLAQFIIPQADGDAAVTEMVVFPPFGGSVADNITRWIRQFDAEGIKLKMTAGDCPAGKYYFVDMTGTYKKPDGPPFLRKTIDAPNHRMLAVMLTVENEGNYFLKLVGPTKSVTAAEGAFRYSFGADKEKEKEYQLEN